MVCKPVEWKSTVVNPTTLAEVRGGYLSQPTGDIYHRYRLLTSHDNSHFFIKLEPDSRHGLLTIMPVINKLQAIPFEIHREGLSFILNNRDYLEECGILMPRFLASLNLKNASDILRKIYAEDESIKNVCNFPQLLQILLQRVQHARSESFILTLASAYEGYQFYLPSFIDFRGRIYRSGILHFHERDLARSLIVFAPNPYDSYDSEIDKRCRKILYCSAPFHYKSFQSYTESNEWYNDNKSSFNTSDHSLIEFALHAKKPFQFIANVLSLERKTDPSTIPVTQDASSSAYQIMSYFLLDVELANRTNLISIDDKIHDLYTKLIEELRDYLKVHLRSSLASVVCPRIDRKLVKAIFMPLIYGKTVISTTKDIHNSLSSLLTNQ
ncbi:putative DNA-directed RNA polymerase [Sesamum alatum]|uniref:DNA-directed RNA polymerase n=2 Tax=Sesamum TaxID=4181 RepID=A0AAE1XI82_9LAMI|nr:putative DNA-directed RNA polymerase [Sesamum alatum]KAK4412253.1 putative DNA-directed RNA polymerase [Sesamum alatum]